MTIKHVTAQCPSKCSCAPYASGGKTVTCGPGLATFPSPLATDTVILSVSVLLGQSSNSIPSLSGNDFNRLTKLQRLTITNSNVQQIAADSFSALSDLKSLDLKRNKMTHVFRDMFRGLGKLDLLDLSDNSRCQIDVDAFDDLAALTTIRLAGIGLTQVDDLLSKLKSLRACDLQRNRLVRLDSRSYTHLSNLKLLDVSFNNLREIQPGMKTVLGGLSSFKLGYNPWRCNCAMIWVKNALPAKFVQPSYHHGGGIVCDKPSKFQFQALKNVADGNMTCIPARVVSCSNQGKIVQVLEGNPITVTCTITGDPFPDVVWKRPDSIQFSYTLQADVTSQTSISIPAADYILHDGTWTLEVFNYNGSHSKMIEIDVIQPTTTSTTAATTKRSTAAGNPHSYGSSTTSLSGNSGSSKTPSQPVGQTLTPVGGNKHGISNGGTTHPVNSLGPNSFSSKWPPHSSNVPHPSVTSFPLSNGPKVPSSSPKSMTATDKSSLPADFNTVLVIAVTASSIVFLIGISIFVLAVLKTKKRSRISAKRRSISSGIGNFELTARVMKSNIGNPSFRSFDN